MMLPHQQLFRPTGEYCCSKRLPGTISPCSKEQNNPGRFERVTGDEPHMLFKVFKMQQQLAEQCTTKISRWGEQSSCIDFHQRKET